MSRMLWKMNLISIVQQLPKEDIETIQGYVEMIEEENQKLKKQYENAVADYETTMAEKIKLERQLEKKYKKTGILTSEMLYEENTKLVSQQKEFIKYLEDESKEIYRDGGLRQNIFKQILQKCREIIGDDKNDIE